jgi:hypothetical protein
MHHYLRPDDDFLRFLNKTCPKLRTLQVLSEHRDYPDEHGGFTDSGLLGFLSNNIVEDLEIERVNLNGAFLTKIGDHGKRLKRLSLGRRTGRSYSISDLEIGADMPALTELELREIWSESDSFIESIT